MSHEGRFDVLNNMLVAFIKSTDAMKAAVDSTPGAPLMTGQWQKCPSLENNVKGFKSHSDALSGSCTKLSLVDLRSMPAAGLQSLVDEILQISQGLISAVMALFSMKLSRPLFDDIHRLAKGELTQVHGLVNAIHTGHFDTCMASIGQVWEMNEAIQKLPLTNKVAYKRALMGILSVVKDTHREFQEARDESVELNKKKTREVGGESEEAEEEGNDNLMDENWGVMMEDGDDDGFTPEEMPYVNASLSLMEKAFTITKVAMEVMSLVSEQPQSVTATPSSSPNSDIEEWVATVFHIIKQFSVLVTDLGMELYTPLSVSSLKAQFDATYTGIFSVQDKLLQAYASSSENKAIDEASINKMEVLLNGTKEIMSQIDLEKMCFVAI